MKQKKYASRIFILYVLSVLVRFGLAVLTQQNASVHIDEFLYTGLARSIGTGDGLLFRGQPADYNSILYPCLLTPIYTLFPAGSNYFRILQLWSTMLMQISIFPIYSIGCELFDGNRDKAFRLSILFALLPEFCFGGVLMSESIVYPLVFTSAYLGLRQIKCGGWINMILLGVCAALLYAAKPGQVILPIVMLVGCSAIYLRKKQYKYLFGGLAGLAVALIVSVVFSLMAAGGVLDLAIYKEQVSIQSKHFDRFIRGLLLNNIYLIILCIGEFFMIPLKYFRSYSPEKRYYLALIYIAFELTAIGTAWVVNMYEYASDIIHTRYFAMYMPLLVQLSVCIPKSNVACRKKQQMIVPFALCAVMIICGGVYGLAKGSSVHTVIITAMSAAVLYLLDGSRIIMIGILIAITLVICRICLYGVKYKKTAISVLALIMILNNTIVYGDMYQSPRNSEAIRQEGTEVLEALNGDEYLYVSPDFANVTYSTLAVNSYQNSAYVTMDSFFNALYKGNGVYKPYTPDQAIRGTTNNSLTLDTDIIILDANANKCIHVNEDNCEHIAGNRGLFAYHITKGERFADSILGNLKGDILEVNRPGILIVYTEQLLNTSARIRFDVTSQQDTELSLISSVSSDSISIKKGNQQVEFEVSSVQQAYNLFSHQCDVTINGFEIVPEYAGK